MQDSGKCHIVPSLPLRSGDGIGVQRQGDAPKGGVVLSIIFKDAPHNGGEFIGNEGGYRSTGAVGDFGQREPVGGRASGPGPQGEAMLVIIFYPLGGCLSFELGEYEHDVEHRAAHGGGGVKVLSHGLELDPIFF